MTELTVAFKTSEGHLAFYKMPYMVYYDEPLNQKYMYSGRDINKIRIYLKSLLEAIDLQWQVTLKAKKNSVSAAKCQQSYKRKMFSQPRDI